MGNSIFDARPCCSRTSRFSYLVALGSTLAFAFIIRGGIGLTNDSRGYLLAADRFASGLGFTIVNGDGDPIPLTQFAPLYSLILSIAPRWGVGLAPFATGVNALSLALTLWAMGSVMHATNSRRGLATLEGGKRDITDCLSVTSPFRSPDPEADEPEPYAVLGRLHRFFRPPTMSQLIAKNAGLALLPAFRMGNPCTFRKLSMGDFRVLLGTAGLSSERIEALERMEITDQS